MIVGLGVKRLLLAAVAVLLVLAGTAQALSMMAGTARAKSLNWNTEAQLQTGHHLTALTCPTKAQCTALANEGTATYEYTFAPSHPTVSTSRQVDATEYTEQLSCPTTSLCVFADHNGVVTAFDPLTPRAVPRTWPAFTEPADALSCPTASECIVLSGVNEATFDPSDLGVTTATGQVGVGADSVSCPTADQCTAVGTGGASSFNPAEVPQMGTSYVTNPIDNGTELLDVSCPTTAECNAVDRNSAVVSFDPENIGAPVAQRTGAALVSNISGPGLPVAISCASSTDCVVVANRTTAFEGDPRTAKWTPETVRYSDGLTAVDCPAVGVCLSGDNESFVFAGTTPSTRVLPQAGRAQVGDDTTTSTGVKVIIRCTGSAATHCSFLLSLQGGAGRAATETVTVAPGSRTVSLALTPTARRLLRKYGKLGAEFTVSQTITGQPSIVLAKRRVTIYAG